MGRPKKTEEKKVASKPRGPKPFSPEDRPPEDVGPTYVSAAMDLPTMFASSALNGLICGMSDEDKNAPFADIRSQLVAESWLLADLMTAEALKRRAGPSNVSDKQLPLPLTPAAAPGV